MLIIFMTINLTTYQYKFNFKLENTFKAKQLCHTYAKCCALNFE